jgi:hypothetical protein
MARSDNADRFAFVAIECSDRLDHLLGKQILKRHDPIFGEQIIIQFDQMPGPQMGLAFCFIGRSKSLRIECVRWPWDYTSHRLSVIKNAHN